MDLRYNERQLGSLYNIQPRHHHVHEEHPAPESLPAQTGAETESRSGQECGHGGHGGAMIFHFGNREKILFGFWSTESTISLLLSCLIVFIMAMLYEALKCYREWLKTCDKKRQEGGDNRRTTKQVNMRTNHVSPSPLAEQYPLPLTLGATAAPENTQSGRTGCSPWLAPKHWYQTLLHMFQVTISFMLMLIFMTFNVWLCIAVVLGAGVGYFIFFARSENVSDHCN